MKKIVMVSATCALWASSAWAGAKQHAPVWVDTVNRTATGSIGSARNSADSVQYIECQTSVNPGATSAGVSCRAKNASGVSYSCYSFNPLIVAVAQSIGPASWIEFVGDASGVCTLIAVNNSSQSEPPLP